MNNFIIGQYGHFDIEKFNKDYMSNLYGIEVCFLKTEDDIKTLKNITQEKKLNIGIHYPLRHKKTRDPLFLDLNDNNKLVAYKSIEDEFTYIQQCKINPEYILFHYPKPVIISNNFDLSRWKFYSKAEYNFESEYSFKNLLFNSELLFKWLSEKATKHNFIPVLELDAINKYIRDEYFLEKLLDKYSKIKLCIDIGRLHIQDIIEPEFKPLNILKRFLKYTKIVHLWNSKVNHHVEYSHWPILPSQSASDGWMNIYSYFDILKTEQDKLKFMFEHRSDLVSTKELNLCYKFISNLLKNN
ncbi:MAG: sugar phosphate isomerase/epimerase [Candidatus Lokiarchaeota archaeon]|nr:sugar phosphate isomerase/epimerase [Candidatus Lokiarchaeota archaeon]